VAVEKIGIVGCGQMGSGIALVCAQAGLQVTVRDVTDKLVKNGIGSIDSYLSKSIEKGKLTQQEKNAAMGRIKGTTDISELAEVDFVLEAVPEKLDIKKSVFAELDKVCSKSTILATNTSVLPIIDIAMATGRPDKVAGTHFFNPAPLMKLIEIVRTVATSDETVRVCQELGKSIGKETVLSQDSPGFIVNKLGTPFMLDAIRMLEAGLATAEDIDKAVVLGLNHPIGPLRLLDFIGVETVLSAASSIYEETKDPRFAPPVLLRRMVTAGWWGRKTGKGFYEYK
jgi:3-hydroxybutyryl-CoA dehydrogenase